MMFKVNFMAVATALALTAGAVKADDVDEGSGVQGKPGIQQQEAPKEKVTPKAPPVPEGEEPVIQGKPGIQQQDAPKEKVNPKVEPAPEDEEAPLPPLKNQLKKKIPVKQGGKQFGPKQFFPKQGIQQKGPVK